MYYFSVFDDPAVFSKRLDDFGYREGEPGVFAVAAFAVLADQPPIPYVHVYQPPELWNEFEELPDRAFLGFMPLQFH